GVLSEGDGKNSMPYLLSLELKERGIDASVFVVHRLDRETEGLTVFALNEASAAALSRSFQNGDAVKIYHALCVGVIEKDADVLCDLLFYDRGRGKSFVVDRERKGVKRASLEYSVLRRFSDRTLLSVRLHTGRTHQIRVQFASRGHALCGDRRYGAPSEYGNKLCLCAVSLSFTHPRTKERMSFETEMSDLLEK
ncbi:MAG: RluA family pseudouridine synthase, partial [Clostridia bacterium]|nr:RluA family pseudouridine synthase [Clostridia bacterium]